MSSEGLYSLQDGYVAIALIDGGEYRAPLAEWDRLRMVWQAGDAFLAFRTVHGAMVELKASRIESMAQLTPESLLEWRRLKSEEKRDEMLSGDG